MKTVPSARSITLRNNTIIGGDLGERTSPMPLIAGPCALESRDHALMMAESLKTATEKYGIDLIFKSSFDKANRTSLTSSRGVGLDQGLRILQQVQESIDVPVITDIHLPDQVPAVAEVVDILQIPAFLCRQTDLLLAAGKSNKPIHVKKGQFLHPSDTTFIVDKIASTGNEQIMLCERGTSFGYRDLVFDPRSVLLMAETGSPVIFDATHSVMSLGGGGGVSGGDRRWIGPYIRAALAVGVHGLFLEVHNDPPSAPSDGNCMLPLNALDGILAMAHHFWTASCTAPHHRSTNSVGIQ